MSNKPVINLEDVPMREFGDGKNFAAQIGAMAHLIGSTGIGCMLHVVKAGQKAFPFHVHHKKHELFIILEGEGDYRFGDKIYKIKVGDICAAPIGGPEVAHQIINSGGTDMKYLGISTTDETDVVEYPDSNKFAVMSRFDWHNPDAGGLRYIGRTDSKLDYFDGEE